MLAAAAPPTRDLPIPKARSKGIQAVLGRGGRDGGERGGTSQPANDSKADQAAFAFEAITELPVPPEKAAAFATAVTFCEASIGFCDDRGDPMLEGVTQSLPVSTQALPASRFVSEIGDFGVR